MAEVNSAREMGQASNKRKATKKQDSEAKKKRPNLKLDLRKIKKSMIQTTLDQWLFKPRTPTRVRFHERVILKRITPHMESWTAILLKGFSDPGSDFAKKSLEGKRQMARDHYWRRERLTARNVRRVTHNDARKYQAKILTL